MRTRAKRTSSRSTSAPNPARANSVQHGVKLLLAFALLFVGACTSPESYWLVPGESTAHDVEMMLGQPADKRAGPDGQTIYWYPQLPWGRASYAARIAEDG